MGWFIGKALDGIGAIFTYVASGTLTFIFFEQLTPADFWWFPYAALALFEFGVIRWKHYYGHVAENPWQALIALFMAGFSVLILGITTSFEVIRWLGPLFHLSLSWMTYVLFLVPLAFPIHILANALAGMFSNEQLDRWDNLFFLNEDKKRYPRPIKIGHGPAWIAKLIGRNRREEQPKETGYMTTQEMKSLPEAPAEEVEAVDTIETEQVKPPLKKLPKLGAKAQPGESRQK